MPCVSTCVMAGCQRPPWNGTFNEPCCAECKTSSGQKHGKKCIKEIVGITAGKYKSGAVAMHGVVPGISTTYVQYEFEVLKSGEVKIEGQYWAGGLGLLFVSTHKENLKAQLVTDEDGNVVFDKQTIDMFSQSK